MQSKELEAIRRLFESAESESNPDRKFSLLEEALDPSYDFATDDPGAPEIVVAGNLRRSHLHRLLEQLSKMRSNIDIAAWFKYIRLFLLRLEPEVKQTLSEDPALNESYRKFMDLWRGDLIAALERSGDGLNNSFKPLRGSA